MQVVCPMNKEFVRKWIKALRSGEYEQGEKFLKQVGDKTVHCCLGVACEVAVEQGLGQWVDEHEDAVYWTKDRASSIIEAAVFPEDLARMLGSDERQDYMNIPIGLAEDVLDKDFTPVGCVRDMETTIGTEPVHVVKLYTLNDSYGISFDQIADLLETWVDNPYVAEPDERMSTVGVWR